MRKIALGKPGAGTRANLHPDSQNDRTMLTRPALLVLRCTNLTIDRSAMTRSRVKGAASAPPLRGRGDMSRKQDVRRLGRRDVLRHGAALTAGLALVGLAPRGFAQTAAHIRFGGYVESQEQLKQTLATLQAYTDSHPGV